MNLIVNRFFYIFLAGFIAFSLYARKTGFDKYYVAPPKCKVAPLSLPDENKDTIYLGTSSGWAAKPNSIAAAKYMRKKFPDTQFVISAVWFPRKDLPKYLKQIYAAGTFYQYQKAPPKDYDGYKECGPLPENWRGDKYKRGNAVMATSKRRQDFMRTKIDYAARLGVNNFKQVDFVWPWTGRWGYDEPSIKAFRQDLNENDPGLNIITVPGKMKTIHFWDYFEDYRGIRFKPSELGLKSWNEYRPAKEIEASAKGATIKQKRNLAVFIALYHYEHLKNFQRFGQWAKAIGGTHQATLNPEDFANGGDFVYILKLADFGTPFIEYFGSPVNVRGAYFHMPAYRRAADEVGKKIGVIKELGQGGHGHPHKSPLIEYIHNYDLTSCGFDQYQNEWTEGSFAQMTSKSKSARNKYLHKRWLVFLGGAYGYKQARNEKSFRPQAKVLSITLRSVNHYMDAQIWDLKSMDSFARYLADEHIDMEETFPGQMPELLESVDYLFYTPIYTRRKDFSLLKNWFAKGGKTLVTHSFIPYSADNGVNSLLSAERIKSAVVPALINGLMKFPNGKGDTVMYRGEDKSYADYLALKSSIPFQKNYLIDNSFKTLKSVDTTITGMVKFGDKQIGEIELPQYWKWNQPEAKTFASIGSLPLISVLEHPNKNKIVYLHCRLQLIPEDMRGKLISALSDYLKLPRIAYPDKARPAFVHAYKFRNGQGAAVVMWDKNTLAKYGLYSGYRNRKAWKNIHYDYRSPGANGSCRYNAVKPGKYRLYWMISGNEKLINTSDGIINLSLDNCLADICFIGLDTPAWNKKIAELKQQRKKLFKNIEFNTVQ